MQYIPVGSVETVDCCDNSRISFTLFLTEGVWSIYGIYIVHVHHTDTSHMFICNNHVILTGIIGVVSKDSYSCESSK